MGPTRVFILSTAGGLGSPAVRSLKSGLEGVGTAVKLGGQKELAEELRQHAMDWIVLGFFGSAPPAKLDLFSPLIKAQKKPPQMACLGDQDVPAAWAQAFTIKMALSDSEPLEPLVALIGGVGQNRNPTVSSTKLAADPLEELILKMDGNPHEPSANNATKPQEKLELQPLADDISAALLGDSFEIPSQPASQPDAQSEPSVVSRLSAVGSELDEEHSKTAVIDQSAIVSSSVSSSEQQNDFGDLLASLDAQDEAAAAATEKGPKPTPKQDENSELILQASLEQESVGDDSSQIAEGLEDLGVPQLSESFGKEEQNSVDLAGPPDLSDHSVATVVGALDGAAPQMKKLPPRPDTSAKAPPLAPSDETVLAALDQDLDLPAPAPAATKDRDARDRDLALDVLRRQVAKLQDRLDRSEAERRRLQIDTEEAQVKMKTLEDIRDQQAHQLAKIGATHHENLRAIELRLESAVFQANRSDKKLEEFRNRVRSDIIKIRLKERELANKLELQKRDAEALLHAKDERLLAQRREIDRLQYEIENLKERMLDDTRKAEDRAAKLTRALRSLKMAQGMLSGIEEEVLPGAAHQDPVDESDSNKSGKSGNGEAA